MRTGGMMLRREIGNLKKNNRETRLKRNGN